jgi:MFS family permease
VRGFRLLVYGLIMASAAGQFELIPVMPVYAHRLGLSGVQQAAVLAATGLAAVAVSLPAGTLCDRFGARRVTLLAGWLMAAGCLGQALAGGFVALFAARLAFGAGYGIVWTAGLAWLAASAPGGAPAIGGTVASGGIGGVLGPAVSGVLAQRFGLAALPLGTAVVFTVITAGLVAASVPAAPAARRAAGLARMKAIASNRGLIWPAAAVISAGLTNSVASLLVPAELHANGVSAPQTGLQFAISGVVFAIGSALTARSGQRALNLPVLCGAVIIQAGAMTLTVASTATIALVAMLYIATLARAVLWTVSYPLAASSAERDGVGVGTMVGLLNGIWAATTVVSPLAAAITATHLGPRAAFALIEGACAVLLGLAAVAFRHREPDRPRVPVTLVAGNRGQQVIPDGKARAAQLRKAGRPGKEEHVQMGTTVTPS